MNACLHRHPFAAVAVIAMTLVAGAWALRAGEGWLGWTRFARESRRTVTADRALPEAVLAWSFDYRGETVTIIGYAPVSVMDAERRLDTRPVFLSGGALREAYMRTFVSDQARSPLVSEIAAQLRAFARRRGLDADEYVELLATAVQSIPYGGGSEHVRAPAEMLADGAGVCTDKSVLLAALLVHEGYDTGVWVFDTEAHVAVAVGSLGPGFRGSGYAFLETTRRAYVGEVGGILTVSGPPHRPPQLIRVGGERRYAAEGESRFVATLLSRARSFADRFGSDVAGSPHDGLERFAGYYATLAAEHRATTRFAEWLGAGSDDRHRVYCVVTRGAGR